MSRREPDVVIRWRAFELRPDPVPLLDPGGDYLTTVWRDHVYPLARKMNMPLQLPPVQPRSRLAHEAAKWAGSHGRFNEFNLALFRAFFESGSDIGKKEVLAGLAVDLGLDPVDLSTALDGNVFTREVIADEDEAHRIGVNAVPAFAMGGRVLAAGVQSVDRLQSLIVLTRISH
ncbi:MAG TPA: DsbA family oxidoreductase [Desulfobacteraceae bacterium]|nr:DsbA family oxidoreductase [Desulfobacteraceae bacterium]